MNEIVKIKKELEQLKSGLKCLLSLFPAATQWTPEHTISNNYKYLENTLVWHQGCIYKCKKDNSGADIQDEYFWEKIGFGFLLAQEQADWNATEGPSYIRNKPWNLGGQEQDPLFQAWLASNPLAGFLTNETDPVFNNWLASNPLSSYITSNQAINSFYPLNSNPAGYLTEYIEIDPVFTQWLNTNPLSNFLTQSQTDTLYYPLNTNPAGYLTQSSVLEFPNLSSFPNPGNDDVVYIAADTGLTYTWNTVTSIYEPTSSPNTGITGVGIVNRVAKFSPNGTTLTSSKIGDGLIPDVITIDYSGRNVNAGNTLFSIQRSQCQVDFTLGNPLLSQTTYLYSDNDLGFEIKSKGFISLKAGPTFSNEGLLVLPTGKLRFSQTPDSGTILDKILVRDTTGNVKSLTPFDHFDAKPIIYQKHINLPVFASITANNVEGIPLTIGGGLTARNWADTNIVTRTQRAGLVSTITGLPGQQIRQTNYGFSRNSGFKLLSGFNMAENAADTGIRFLLGVRNSIGIYSNTEPNTLINILGFCRLSTSNNLHIIHNDNTGTATTIDLGSNFPANTDSIDKYIFKIETVPTGVYFRIDRIETPYFYEVTVTTDIPGADLGLSFGGFIVDTAGANTNTGFDWYGTYVQV